MVLPKGRAYDRSCVTIAHICLCGSMTQDPKLCTSLDTVGPRSCCDETLSPSFWKETNNPARFVWV